MGKQAANGLDRERLRRLLGLLGSDHDGEVLNAARLAHGMLRDAGLDWAAVIPDAEGAPAQSSSSADIRADLDRLDQLLASEKVADVMKLRFGDMRRALMRGLLKDADRRLLRILHRKAIMDGVIIEL